MSSFFQRFFLQEISLLLYTYGILLQLLHVLVYPHPQLRIWWLCYHFMEHAHVSSKQPMVFNFLILDILLILLTCFFFEVSLVFISCFLVKYYVLPYIEKFAWCPCVLKIKVFCFLGKFWWEVVVGISFFSWRIDFIQKDFDKQFFHWFLFLVFSAYLKMFLGLRLLLNRKKYVLFCWVIKPIKQDF